MAIFVDSAGRTRAPRRRDPGADRTGLVLAQKFWIVPLFGTRKLEQLDENLGAIKVALSGGDLSEIKSDYVSPF